jgi:ZIP family zinc transporter
MLRGQPGCPQSHSCPCAGLPQRAVQLVRPARYVAGIVSLLAGALVVGAALGLTLLSHATGGLLVFVLASGLAALAALLFLVTEELLAEAPSEDEFPWLTAAFFVGFLLFLLLSMVA